MPVSLPPQSFTWIFAMTMIFAFFDAYSIGANDVANSFATSVGSRSITLWQAVCIAIFTEFSGALALGAETASTIKDGIIRADMFAPRPDLLMVAFMCALIGSSCWVMFATYMGWPVSTTHSIIGALVGTGVSAFGTDAVNWGWNNKGLSQIVASWFLAPSLAGVLGAVIFLLTRTFILNSPNSLRRGIMAIPIYFTFTIFVVSYYIATKNGKSTLEIKPKGGVVGAPLVLVGDVSLAFSIVGGVSAFVLIFCYSFVVPYFIRRLEKEEKLKWYHLFVIHFVPTQPHDENLDLWLKRTLTPHLLEEAHQVEEVDVVVEKTDKTGSETTTTNSGFLTSDATVPAAAAPAPDNSKPSNNNILAKGVSKVKSLLYNSIFMDVASVQRETSAEEAHKVAILYDNKTEFLYSFLQVMTAAFASFSHGSNDVANALGPAAGVYQIWSTGTPSSKVEIPKWLLAYCAIGIDFGLAFYGYNIMRSLGNNLTYHSPSRGFAMELAAALAVVTASFLALPVSTTQCIMGATVAVGLCNGSLKGVNWKMFGLSFFSWMLTVPVAGTLAGILFTILTRGPSFTNPPK
ncbi:Na+/Pi symporter [Dinochytrium kinnereticum]|nr:Na+/Pi symporter [Dinochytrium kinnereticum]